MLPFLPDGIFRHSYVKSLDMRSLAFLGGSYLILECLLEGKKISRKREGIALLALKTDRAGTQRMLVAAGS